MASVFTQGSRLLLSLFFILSYLPQAAAQEEVERHAKLMGSAFVFKAIHQDSDSCAKAVEAAIHEVERIEALISSWNPNSQTSEINRMAGIRPVKVDMELFRLIGRAKRVSQLTSGAFDISFASADRIWTFDGSMNSLPDSAEVAASVRRIDHQKIILEERDTTVFLKEKGMKIGFGAIGKGFAANRARQVMENMGITQGLVNAGGDLICWGKDKGGEDWHIGIADPLDRQRMLAWLVINDLAVVTSGDYERFAIIGGQRYAHIIHPKTGYPVQGVSSVSILCPDTELADALATATFVLGPEEGIALLEKLRGIEGLLVDDKGKIFSTGGLDLQYYRDQKPTGLPVKKIGLKDE